MEICSVILNIVLCFWIIMQYRRNRRFFKEAEAKINRSSNYDAYASKEQNPAERVIDFIEYSNDVLEQRYQSELLQRSAELKALQSQIDPHFLYNTLDTIRGKAYGEKAYQTAEMIEMLAQMFRYTIGQTENLVSVEEELNNIKTYINIQQYRFNTEYGLEEEIEDREILEFRLPRLTLQPIVENAVKYGLRKSVDNILKISVYSTQNRNVISITDNGMGMSTEQLKRLNRRLESGELEETSYRREGGNSIALVNVNARLRLTYGPEYGLSVQSMENIGTKVTIILPKDGNHEDGTITISKC